MLKTLKKYRLKKCSTLYHLSSTNLDGITLNPRVPGTGPDSDYSLCEDEDRKIKMVCFSTSISGAFRAIDFRGKKQILYVHKLNNKDDLVKKGLIVRPTENFVPDRYITKEHWSLWKSELKCIGVAKISSKRGFNYFLKSKYPVKIEWLEKYDN